MSPIVFKGQVMNSDLILSALKIEEVGRRFHLQNIELVGFTRRNKRTPEIYLKIKTSVQMFFTGTSNLLFSETWPCHIYPR